MNGSRDLRAHSDAGGNTPALWSVALLAPVDAAGLLCSSVIAVAAGWHASPFGALGSAVLVALVVVAAAGQAFAVRIERAGPVTIGREGNVYARTFVRALRRKRVLDVVGAVPVVVFVASGLFLLSVLMPPSGASRPVHDAVGKLIAGACCYLFGLQLAISVPAMIGALRALVAADASVDPGDTAAALLRLRMSGIFRAAVWFRRILAIAVPLVVAASAIASTADSGRIRDAIYTVAYTATAYGIIAIFVLLGVGWNMTVRLLPWPGLSVGEVFLALGHDMWRSRPTAAEVLTAGGTGHPDTSDLTYEEGRAQWNEQLGRIRRTDMYRAAVLAASLAVYVCLPVALIGLGVAAYARPVGLWFLRVAGFVALCAAWVVAICGLRSRYRTGLGALAPSDEDPRARPSLSFGWMYGHDVVHPVSVVRLQSASPYDLHQPADVGPRSVPLYGLHPPALVPTPVADKAPGVDKNPGDDLLPTRAGAAAKGADRAAHPRRLLTHGNNRLPILTPLGGDLPSGWVPDSVSLLLHAHPGRRAAALADSLRLAGDPHQRHPRASPRPDPGGCRDHQADQWKESLGPGSGRITTRRRLPSVRPLAPGRAARPPHPLAGEVGDLTPGRRNVSPDHCYHACVRSAREQRTASESPSHTTARGFSGRGEYLRSQPCRVGPAPISAGFALRTPKQPSVNIGRGLRR